MAIQLVKSTYHSMKRLKQISRILIKYGFTNLLSKLGLSRGVKVTDGDATVILGVCSGERMRNAFEELGPSFIKLGQLLSLQPDIIPPDFIEEFRKLQDEVSPFPYEEVAEIIEFELGKPVEELFKSFNKGSIAAASVAQVHLAELKSGEKVAVKIQRPGIELIIREDIKILFKIARMLVKTFKNIDLLNPVGIISEFEGFIYKELDFAIEGSSMEKFRINFKDDPDILIPKVFWELSTSNILVMEHFEGCSIDDLKSIHEMGLDTKEIARKGLTSFAKQVMEHGFYHADPHPGNAIVMADGRIALIDFGITGFMDNELRQNLADVVVCYADHDYERLISVFENMGIVTKTGDRKSFKQDLIELSEPYYGRDLEHISVKEIFDKVCKLAIKHGIRLPRDLILLFKSLIAGENMGRVLSADASVLEVMRPYATKFLEQLHDPKVIFDNLKYDLFNYSKVARHIPDYLHNTLKNISKGDQQFKFDILGLENFGQEFGHAISRLTLGILIGSSLIAGAWVLNSDKNIFPVTILWLGLVDVSLTTVLGLMGYAFATILGFWLIYSILRGGRLT
jgi:ubiquinone biosynthesis protein